MKLALIPAGEFLMGAAGDDKDADIDEKPRHKVRISQPFYMGSHEVTVGQFRRFVQDSGYQTEAERSGQGTMGLDEASGVYKRDKKYNWRTPGFAQTDEHPVTCVSWNDAVAFCAWLEKKEGKKYALPTEAQWEYCCRAGTTTRYASGDDPETVASVGNVADASFKRKFSDLNKLFLGITPTTKTDDRFVFTSPVGRYRANAFGLFDMHGNVHEWCADWYGRYYYKNSPALDPTGPSTGDYDCRVVRGGCFIGEGPQVSASNRAKLTPQVSDCFLGFRVVRAR
jgi:formylglycine-generating enzyme required for sulfatase activity